MDERVQECQQQYDAIQSDIHNFQVKEVATASKSLNELIQNLKRVEEEYADATRMSNVGSSQFVAALEKIIQRLEDTENYLGNVRI